MEKIKITRKEIEDMYDIEDDSHQEDKLNSDQEEVTVTENFEEYTERKDKEKYGIKS